MNVVECGVLVDPAAFARGGGGAAIERRDREATGVVVDRSTHELVGTLATLRGKARWLARNSGTMKRFMQLMRDNVVGENGFSFQVGNPRVEAAWSTWCRKPTVDGQMSMVEMAKQMLNCWCRDGEYFFEFVVNKRFPDMISINPLEADMIDETIEDLVEPAEAGIAVSVAALAANPGFHPAEAGNEHLRLHRHPVPLEEQPAAATRFVRELADATGKSGV